MMKYFWFLLLSFVISPFIHAQTTFLKKYSVTAPTCGYSLALSPSGTIAYSGLQFDSAGNGTLLQSRIDATGKSISNHRINTGSAATFTGGLAPVKDGGFIILTSHVAADGTHDIVIARTRTNGSIGWKRRIATPADEIADRIVPVAGGFILAGTTNLDGNVDLLLVKITEAGAISWMKAYGDGETEHGHSLVATGDGGVMVSGSKPSTPYVLRVDGSGNLMWAFVPTVSHPDRGRISVTKSGDYYYLAGTGGGNGHHGGETHTGMVLTKLTGSGSVVWSKDYHAPQPSVLWHLTGTKDGKVVATGTTGTTPRAFVFEIDPAGKILWKRVFSEPNSAAFFSMEAPDGGILTTGCGAVPRYELMIAKTDSAGRLGVCKKWITTTLGIRARNDSMIQFFPQVRNYPAVASVPVFSLTAHTVQSVPVCQSILQNESCETE